MTMNLERSERGFWQLNYPAYLFDKEGMKRLAAESSAIGDYPDSFDRPGSSFLWIGEHHHLSREEVQDFIAALSRWVLTGRLGE